MELKDIYHFVENRLKGKKADILLINPPLSLDCGISESPIQLSPPIGLGYLATISSQMGYGCAIIDAEGFQISPEQVAEVINNIRPRVVGFSIVTPGVEAVQKIIRRLPLPYPFLIAGGIHPTVLPFHTSEMLPEVNLIVRGEAEEIWRELCLRDFDPSRVDLPMDVLCKECYKDTLIFTAYRAPKPTHLPRLDQANFSKFEFFANHPDFEFTIVGSRGCNFSCGFCAAAAFRNHHTYFRDIDDVLDEVSDLAALGPKRFHFIDDNTFGSKSRTLKLTKGIADRKLNISWRAFARADQFDREIASAIRDSGCYKVAFGVESGSPDSLTRMNKRLKVDAVLRAAELCHTFSVQSKAFFVLGYPGDTEKDLQASIDLAIQARFDQVQFNLTRAFPGTTLYENLKHQGYQDDELLHYDNLRAIAPDGTPSMFQITQYCIVNKRSICPPYSNDELARWVGKAYAEVAMARSGNSNL